MARIAIIHHSGIIGGAGVSLLNTINALCDRHDITVFASDSPSDMLESLKEISKSKGIKVISYGKRIGALTHYSGGDKVGSLRFLYRSSLIIKQWKYWNITINELNPDIVIVNSIILSWMSLLPAIKSRKSICFVRETICGDLTRRINRLFRKCLKKFTRVSFISKFDCCSWSLPASKSVIIYNCFNQKNKECVGSRAEVSKELGLNEESFHILYVGGVSHMKGIDLAVNATLSLNKICPTELIAVGIDFNDRRLLAKGKLSPYESDLEKLVYSEDNREIIHILGRQKNMGKCFTAADVLLFPMRAPHQARPVFEAGVYALPVIITDFPNIREFVINGVNGLVFEKDNLNQLLENLKKIAINPIYREQLGQENLKLSLRNHTMKSFDTSINTLIDNML